MLHCLQDDRFDLVGVLLRIVRMDTHDEVVCHTIPGCFIVQGRVGQTVSMQRVSHFMGVRKKPGEGFSLFPACEWWFAIHIYKAFYSVCLFRREVC